MIDTDRQEWLAKAIPIVEGTIDGIVSSFANQPYNFRSERSIHAEIYRILSTHEDLSFAHYPIFRFPKLQHNAIQLEWPEANKVEGKGCRLYDMAIFGRGGRRGFFGAADLEHGSAAPDIVIEVGLRSNNPNKHLSDDFDKLRHNGVLHPYLVELRRGSIPSWSMEKLVRQFSAEEPFKVAYCHYYKEKRRIKLLGDEDISGRVGVFTG